MTRTLNNPFVPKSVGGAILSMIVLLACSESGAPSSPPVPSEARADSIKAGESAVHTPASPSSFVPALRRVAGQAQQGAARERLAQPLIVAAVGPDGRPIPGLVVRWSTPNGGSVVPETSVTGANGEAAAAWTLGSSAGAQVAIASADRAYSASFLAFSTSGTPLPVASITLGLGNSWLEPGLASSMRAAAVDINLQIVNSASILWTVRNPSVLHLEVTGTSPGVSTVRITGVAPGTSYVLRSAGGITDSVLVRVFPTGGRPGPGNGCGGCG